MCEKQQKTTALLSVQCVYTPAGEDFSPDVIVRTVQSASPSGEEDFTIELMDDDTLENTEVFLLRLDVNASDPSDQEILLVTSHWTIIRIRADSDGEGDTEQTNHIMVYVCCLHLIMLGGGGMDC